MTTSLSDELGDAVDIVLIGKADGFVFGSSKLDVMVVALGADLDPAATSGPQPGPGAVTCLNAPIEGFEGGKGR